MLRNLIDRILPTPHGRTNGIRHAITLAAGGSVWVLIGHLGTLLG